MAISKTNHFLTTRHILQASLIIVNRCFVHDYRGSAIARIVGVNVKENPIFHDEVKMWVFEEIVGGRKLTEIINQEHENTKYLPGFKIPNNVVS